MKSKKKYHVIIITGICFVLLSLYTYRVHKLMLVQGQVIAEASQDLKEEYVDYINHHQYFTFGDINSHGWDKVFALGPNSHLAQSLKILNITNRSLIDSSLKLKDDSYLMLMVKNNKITHYMYLESKWFIGGEFHKITDNILNQKYRLHRDDHGHVSLEIMKP